MRHAARPLSARRWGRSALAGAVLCAAASSSSVTAAQASPTASTPLALKNTVSASAPQAVPMCQLRAFERVSSGHLDFGAVITGSGLTPALKDDRTQPARWKSPSSMIVELGPAARRAVPGGLGFIAPAGSAVYMIGGTQQAGVPWLGWNTQHPSILSAGASDVTMSLLSVHGPGHVAVFTPGSFGQPVGQRIMDTVGGPRSATVPLNTHAHGNWVFTKPGAYQLRIGFSVRAKDGRVLSGASTLNVSAGLTNPAAAFSGCGSTTSAAPPAAPKAGGQGQNATHNGAGSASQQTSNQGSSNQGNSNPGGANSGGDSILAPASSDSGASGSAAHDAAHNGTGPKGTSQDGMSQGSTEAASARNASSQSGFHWPSAGLGALGLALLAAFGWGVYRMALPPRRAAGDCPAQGHPPAPGDTSDSAKPEQL